MTRSKHRAETPSQGIAATMRHGAELPSRKLHLDGLIEVLLESLCHALPSFIVQDQDVALGVEIERTEIEVRGANDGDIIVRQESLGVENRCLILEDAHPVGQQRGEVTMPGMAHQGHVTVPREEEAHIHAAPGSLAQEFNRDAVRGKVGIRDPKALPGCRHHRREHRGRLAVPAARSGIQHQGSGAGRVRRSE